MKTNMVTPKQVHEAKGSSKKHMSSRKDEFMVHYRNAGEISDLVAG